MPDRDGYTVLAEVRARETTLGRRVPIAAVSAYAHAEDRRRALRHHLINIWPNRLIPRPLHLR